MANIPGTTIPKPDVQLSGEDGNAFAVMGAVTKAMRRAGAPQAVLDTFREEATSGDYDNVLATAMKYAEVL